MNDPSSRALPPILTEKLAEFRKRVRVIKFIEGALAALFGLALSWLLVFVLDRFGETPAWLRTTLLIAGAAVPGIGFPLLWHRWVWKQRRLEDVARLVRRHFPRLGDQLLGIVELAREDSALAGRSERLVQAAIAQAADAVKDKDLSSAVPNPHHRRWAWSAGSLLLIAVAAGALVPEAARNAAARWLMPWRDTDRYTFAQVDELPKTLVVPYAEPFDLPTALKSETRWTPEHADARIPGQPRIRVENEEGAYPFAFPPQKADTQISLSVGDDREKVTLEPRTRPELTALNAKVRLPDYLKYDRDMSVEVRGGTVRLLGGASVSWIAEASRELKSAKVDDQATVIAGGKLVTDYLPVAESTEHTFDWKDVLGLGPREPLVLKVQAVEDESPAISARRETQEQVVLDTEVVAFDLAVQDDFGIRQVGLEWSPIQNANEAAKDGKITAAGAPDMRSLETRATFSAAREGLKPQSLEIRAWAEDYLPGRERSYSAAFVLHVLNSTDHALWLTEQFGKWLDAARETYEREQQLHQTNKELRDLAATELDRPENRRRISRQAADEQANAGRLDALNDAGRRLVEQGTRNPEFDAERLESWATMLQMLDDIAEKRMPSVADLLKESSSAAGAKPGQAPDPNAKPSGDAPKTASNSPTDPAKPAGQSQGPPKPEAPSIKNGELPAAPGPPKPVDPNAEPAKPVPSIADNEKGYLKPIEAKPEEPGAPKKPSSGKLGLPQTTLGALPSDKKPSPPQSPAQEKLDTAVQEQSDLLAEFAKIADDLSELLASLEASTFVKRLKAASRAQMEIASSLNTETLSAFGLELKEVSGKPAVTVAEVEDRAKKESETVYTIQTDLAAYVNRKPDMRFTSLLDAMKSTEIVREIDAVGANSAKNLTGQSIISAEFWADTLDRWAEDLVSAAQCSSCKGGSKDSLPPEIVLKVMQALHDEMDLRDETREMEKSRPALSEEEYSKKVKPLSETQLTIAENVRGAVNDIVDIPQGAQKFGKELKLLSLVTEVMMESRSILGSPDTGPEAIAAETEAIELLLQARRQKPGGGGGGGSNPGGGSGTGKSSTAALSKLGEGADVETEVKLRAVGQSTGRAGQEFPEEFRTGLDAYFNALEKEGGAAQ